MNKGLAHILMKKLKDIPFIDLAAGLVATQTKPDYIEDETGQARMIMTKFPVTSDLYKHGCCVENELVMICPDSSLAGLFYFEDQGTDFVGRRTQFYELKSKLRLIIWVNTQRLNPGSCISVVSPIVAEIIKRFDINPFNEGEYSTVSAKVVSLPKTGPELFSQYTYNNDVMQFLMPPFESIGIDLQVTFSIHPSCFANIQKIIPSC